MQVRRRLRSRTLDLRPPQTRLDGADDTLGEPVLQVEDVLHLGVEAVGPDVSTGLCLDQLADDANVRADSTDAALEHVAHAEFAPDLLHVHGPALVGEAGTARDDEEGPHARQRGDDVVDHPVGEVLLLRVATEVLERQHRQRRLVGQGQSRGVLEWHHRHGGCLRIGRYLFDHSHSQLVAPARYVDHHLSAQQLAQRGHLNGDVVLLDHKPGPDALQQLVLADDPVAALDQAQQQVERSGPKHDIGAFGDDTTFVGPDLEAADEEASRHGSISLRRQVQQSARRLAILSKRLGTPGDETIAHRRQFIHPPAIVGQTKEMMMNLIQAYRNAKQGNSIAGARPAVQWFERAAPRLLVRPWRLDEGYAARTAKVLATVVNDPDVALGAILRKGGIGRTIATLSVRPLLTLFLLPTAALSLGCDSVPASKIATPMLSHGFCVAPPDSKQADQVSSQSGTEC